MSARLTLDSLNVVDYNERRLAVAAKVAALGHGAKMRLSHDLRVSPTLVTSVVNGRYIDEQILARLEDRLQELGA